MTCDPLRELNAALRYIEDFQGAAEDFELVISDELNDAMGANMAIIGDKVLDRGWIPDGFEQRDGCRVYRYKAVD
jgi:hypothetical protein